MAGVDSDIDNSDNGNRAGVLVSWCCDHGVVRGMEILIKQRLLNLIALFYFSSSYY